MDLSGLQTYLNEKLSNHIVAAKFAYGELTLDVKRESIVDVLTFLRDDAKCQFHMLCDLCGADFPGRADRFEVIYNLLSVTKNWRIRVRAQTDETTPVPSIVNVHSAAGWFEREAWDLYGILFAGNPDLRRLLTDYGFEGHPLRKDFPLTGFVEVRYDTEQKRVVYEPVKLNQDFRNFDYLSPWEGLDKLLPGDEKAGIVHQPIGATNGKRKVGS